jgi:hypothetical protein
MNEISTILTSNTPLKQLISMQNNLSENCEFVNLTPKVRHEED